MIAIKENAVTPETFEELTSRIVSGDFPWYYVPGTAQPFSHEGLYQGSFAHTLPPEHAPYIFTKAFKEVLGDIKWKRLLRIRVGLIPICPHPVMHEPHVDHPLPHVGMLLYLNDSDGNTVFYNEQYDPSHPEPYPTYLTNVLKDKLTVDEMVKPKENRAVIFDGLTYHASSAPMSTKRRMAISYTFEV